MASETQHLSEVVLENIKNLIVQTGMKPGDKLPPERKLAELFNTSRAPVREALKLLEFAGILYRKGGYGLYVKEVSNTDPFVKLNFALTTTCKTINELMELRISLESDAAYFAAIRRDKTDLAAMETTIAKMQEIHKKHKSKKDIELLQQESLNFHKSIIVAARNSVLQGVYDQLLSLLQLSRQYMVARLTAHSDPLEDHTAIYKKILTQDAEGARIYMKKHLIDTKDSYNLIVSEDNETCL